MKNIIYLFAMALLFSACSRPVIDADYGVVPLPQEIVKTDGKGFSLSGSTKILYPKGNANQQQNAEFLAEYLKFSTGIDLTVTDEEIVDNAIILKADYQSENTDAYSLTVTDKQIVIDGASDAGTFYGIQTLRKSVPAMSEGKQVLFPAVKITDYPRFQHRGMMLDVSRHFFPVEFVKRYIDILALHNINKFHWHLTDDQGWRIEIKKYPKLTEIGSQREETVIGRNSGEFDGKPYGGFYTQDEIRDIVDYAQKRYITVIPEVDLPGHMLAALTAYPELGCTGGPYKVSGEWGVFDDVLCPGNEEIFTFLEGVFSEVIELFPSELIHIGGDECPKTRWKECPKCQARIKQLGLKSDKDHSKEDRLQSYVMTRMEKFLNDKGRRIIGWDEILEGGLAPDATVMSWRGVQGGITAAKQDHDVIMTPTSYLYFDYYQTNDTKDEPLAIGGYVPIEKVYSFDPVPAELTVEQAKHIIGTQANLWVEYILDGPHVEYMVLPRMAALSEIQWTEPVKKNLDQFYGRLANLVELYKKYGYNYAKHITNVSIRSQVDTEKGVINSTLTTYDNVAIHYTLDGTDPTKNSLKYSAPIEVSANTTLKAVVARGDELSKISTAQYNFNKATARTITLDNDPSKRYAYNGATTLIDGQNGGDNYSDGTWLGFVKYEPAMVIDLGKKTDVSEVQVGTFVNQGDWIFGAAELEVLTSDDNKNFKRVFFEKYPQANDKHDKGIETVKASFPKTEAQYVRIVIKNVRSMPAWHPGKGNPAFIFIDEVVIN